VFLVNPWYRAVARQPGKIRISSKGTKGIPARICSILIGIGGPSGRGGGDSFRKGDFKFDLQLGGEKKKSHGGR